MRASGDKLPGHALALSLQKVWEVIRDQKDLNLPAHKVRVASLAHKVRRSHGLALQREFWLRNVEPSDLMERAKCAASWLEITPGVVFQVMVANIRCTEIMEEQLRSLAEDQAWASLRQESEAGSVPNFGSRAGALLDSCITGAADASHSNGQPVWESFLPAFVLRPLTAPGIYMRSISLLVLRDWPRPM